VPAATTQGGSIRSVPPAPGIAAVPAAGPAKQPVKVRVCSQPFSPADAGFPAAADAASLIFPADADANSPADALPLALADSSCAAATDAAWA
jgi:hypothetical protein